MQQQAVELQDAVIFSSVAFGLHVPLIKHDLSVYQQLKSAFVIAFCPCNQCTIPQNVLSSAQVFMLVGMSVRCRKL